MDAPNNTPGLLLQILYQLRDRFIPQLVKFFSSTVALLN